MSDQGRKNLEKALDSIERNLSTKSKPINVEDFKNNDDRNRQRFKIDKYKNKNSIFKRPPLPLQKCLLPKSTPNYVKNPEKYTHYSLSDVTDLSDQTNKSAAFNFLREIEQRKQTEIQASSSSSSSEPTKILFKNSTRLKPNHDQDKIDETKIQGGKFLMSEYVVGNAIKKKKKQRPEMRSNEKEFQLKLSHLEEDE